jgi:hypothetical protein
MFIWLTFTCILYRRKYVILLSSLIFLSEISLQLQFVSKQVIQVIFLSKYFSKHIFYFTHIASSFPSAVVGIQISFLTFYITYNINISLTLYSLNLSLFSLQILVCIILTKISACNLFVLTLSGNLYSSFVN